MQSLRRTAVAAARTSRTPLSRQSRRYAHDEAHGHASPAVDEPMGWGFYGTIAVIPAGLALYSLSRTDGDDSKPYFTRLIADATTGLHDKWTTQNDLHVRMIEQAGEDRVLFLNTKPQEHVEMKFPEIMNVGSPYNVPAGSQVQMDKVIEKYKKLAYEDNERKLEKLRNNDISSEKPFEGKTRVRKAPDMDSVPYLPELNFSRLLQRNDINASPWPDDALRTANATPIRSKSPAVMPSYTSHRNVSGPFAVDKAPMATDDNNSWARPNHHSTPNSKTSQYIDKITQENDRLRRELLAEKLAREDEAKRVSAAQTRAEDSRAEYQHLQVLADTNARAIERKDRKLEELRATLDTEIRRRKMAEQRAEEALKMLGDTRSETQRQLAQAYEMKGLADTNLETARDGFKRITDGYENKVRLINQELNELRRKRLEDADKIKRQAIISDQLQHESSRSNRTENKLTNLMEAYKKEHRKEMDALIAEAERLRRALPEKEREAQKLVDAMVETRDKMRWVMTQHERQTASQS
ncbi:hypothetical protein COCMIDRAFT_40162 [Bipolaris oryzae ATCC 44560]|uniref:Uncharacterized protein n=1 Tax=Bipolaris oryzae ATCC 44560 TaxID=930090 RepID=W6YVZ7_COCMI|nr:uncharacterized protein COCMIDRAFT_40162 [Bipolaris oryzae ATCC 44560]EUC41705.1 hypothetical protein COCMIDRAFT_40162 [Bipolaris oryzae ATCC 44560]